MRTHDGCAFAGTIAGHLVRHGGTAHGVSDTWDPGRAITPAPRLQTRRHGW